MKRTPLKAKQGFKKLTLEEVKAKQLKRNPKLIGYGTGCWGKKAPTKPKFKRSKIKKPKLTPISKLKKQLWSLVSLYIRERDYFLCITCGRTGQGSQIHAGHMIPNASGGALLRYHPLNIHAQCYHCNINLGSNGAEYYRVMLARHGKEIMEKLFDFKNHSIQADRYFYTSMIELYKQGNQQEIIKFLESYL